MEILRNIYSLNAAEPGGELNNLIIRENVNQLTNLSLAFPTIIDFSIKRHLMTVPMLQKGLAVRRACKVTQTAAVRPTASGSLPRVDNSGIPSSDASRLGH